MKLNKDENLVFNSIFSWLIIFFLLAQVTLTFFLIIKMDQYVKLTLKGSNNEDLENNKISYIGKDISFEDDPFLGNLNDPKIVMIEFADFQCPFCAEANDKVDYLLDKYSNSILYVYKDYPLTNHEFAMNAAIAANCLGVQGKYWEMHRLIFKDQKDIDISSLRQKALEIELDIEKFNNCLNSNEFKQEIQNDIRDAEKFGIKGTPTFIVNGFQVDSDMLEIFIDALMKEHTN
jgi:protein-disulfide isomerase